ncbi:MAG: SufS family cysteine desulfurase [Ezakiella sp.]|nr:SufS family cysteine desulfurase [Ezakiella sp.]MDD7472464.1 SufS family cysteine desulfurase [Bacillota bacterium]MDY3923293.1 SufS family cysteine desulfurase [Ezakiella sp.]
MKFNPEEIKKDFPVLKEGYIYLDSAATTQKPIQVIEAVSNYYLNDNANPHRSAHLLGVRATEDFESARETVRRFINAKSTDEIVFTKNATESLNIISNSFLKKLNAGDEILVTIAEHHANYVNWLNVAEVTGAKMKVAYLNDDRTLDIEDFLSKITPKTKVVAFQETSNVTGAIVDVKSLIKEIRKKTDAKIVVDGSQSVPHKVTDVRDMDCDYFAFSGHKLLAPMGIGVLYGKDGALNELSPLLYGGDMIEYVYETHASFLDAPFKFEGGTQNVGAAIGLKAAIEYLEKIGMDNIAKYEKEISKYAYEKISALDGVVMYTTSNEERSAVISFNIDGAHPHDIATILDSKGIMIRSGHHCAQPLHRYLGRPFSARASFYIYNTIDEVDKLAEGINYVKEVLKLGIK